jgi:hypothetical protein
MWRLPEWSISQTFWAPSRQTSMKWLPPPRLPTWPTTLPPSPCARTVSAANPSMMAFPSASSPVPSQAA